MGTSGAEVFWSPEGQGAGAWGPSLATGHAPSGAVHSGPGEEGPASVHKFLCLGYRKAGKITSLSSPTDHAVAETELEWDTKSPTRCSVQLPTLLQCDVNTPPNARNSPACFASLVQPGIHNAGNDQDLVRRDFSLLGG